MDAHVRVWVTGLSSRSEAVADGLLRLGHEVEAPTLATSTRDESSAARWADVVIVVTSGAALTPDQSLLFGLALGSKTPVLFVGPMPVTSPALAANSYTIVDPVPIEAVGFQVSTLGGARAERRSVTKARTSLKPAEPDSPRISRRDVNTSDLNFSSLLEQEVFQVLSLDPDVISIRRETQRPALSSTGRSYVPDFLVWIDGAEPFNPIPVEVGNQDVVPSLDRLVEAMLASQAKVGILINSEAPSKPSVHEPKSGLAVIQVGILNSAGQNASLGRAVREARNHLVHGGELRG